MTMITEVMHHIGLCRECYPAQTVDDLYGRMVTASCGELIEVQYVDYEKCPGCKEKFDAGTINCCLCGNETDLL